MGAIMAALTVWKFPHVVYDKVKAEFSGTQAELIQANLSAEQDARLRAALANEA
jgi:uncharacterized membrane protein